jgi:twitching motility protein PilI
MPTLTHPFEILQHIARQSKARAKGLPAQEEAIELWNGIGFKLAGQHYVAPMGEVIEILHMPRFTQIPGVKNWLLGVANVRGRLLPIMDLAIYFDLKRTKTAPRDRRVLVVERDDLISGFAVDAVLGMQYFSADTFQETDASVPESMQPFVPGCYRKNEELWGVFSTYDLTEDEGFMDVAQW